MPEITELRDHTRDFFANPPARSAKGLAAARPFSEFNPDDMARVVELVGEFSRLADEEPGDDGLAAVLDAAETSARRYGGELVRWALTLFITHHRGAARLPIPSMEEVDPHLLVPSPRPRRRLALGAVESDLDWYREDPATSDHHRHWHAVYPWSGVNGVIRPRQGELFMFMHRQMLARYDTERVALDLQRLRPLDDYTQELEPYDPGPSFTDPPPGRTAYSPRGRGHRLDESTLADWLAQWRERLLDAARTGQLRPQGQPPVAVTADRLAAAIESSIVSVTGADPRTSFYGSKHNYGHVAMSELVDGNDPGVVGSVETAVRDPIFYRWHQAVDDILFAWEETQPANDPSQFRPDVVVTAEDIALFFTDAPAGETTDELQTQMLTRPLAQLGGSAVDITYLDQRPFGYRITAQNRGSDPLEVTVRIFLAAADLAGERRSWIEMDKFTQTLPSGSAEITRLGADSAVIRRGPKPPEPISQTGTENGTSYCQCGWPYNLLVPRGTADGMAFQLMVMLTDGALDRVERDPECPGSMSFCGLRDTDYPDQLGMGHPFDRPFPDRSIADTIEAEDHMAVRDLVIRLRPGDG